MPGRLVVGFILSSAFAVVSAKDSVCDDAKNDMEIRECMSAEVDKADRKLATYIDAAKTQIARDKTIELSIDGTQKSWTNYRSMQCSDVYKYWADGSYRYYASLRCMLDVTKKRTHDIWTAYLTFPDSTLAILPEP